MSTARVDLHMHSTASDGESPPEELARLCAAAGLDTVALTDHNTTRHVAAMTAACADRGITVVPGCEVTARWRGREHHCLAYFVPLEDARFEERIERVRAADLARSRTWVEKAGADGIPLTWEAVEAAVGADRVPPFPLLADLLLAAAAGDPRLDSYRQRRGTLWADWFAPGRPWGTEPPWLPELPEAIAWVREAGAVPVLAHPGIGLGGLDEEACLGELAALGLGGVEAWTTWHKEVTSVRYAALGEALGIAVTAGADYHGPRVKGFVKAPGQVSHNGAEVVEAVERARS